MDLVKIKRDLETRKGRQEKALEQTIEHLKLIEKELSTNKK